MKHEVYRRNPTFGVNMERSKYYGRNMTIELVHAAENLTPVQFQKWVDQGAKPNSTILQQQIEQNHLNSRRGQIPPASMPASTPVKASKSVRDASLAAVTAGQKHGDLGLELRENRSANEYEKMQAQECLISFAKKYQQLVVSQENFDKLAEFLRSRQSKVTLPNLEIAYQELFAGGHLSVRDIERRTVASQPEAPADGNANLRHKLFTGSGIRIAAPKAKKAATPPIISKPVTETEIVETVYSPTDVRRFPASMMEKFLKPMRFSGTDVLENQTASEFLSAHPELIDKTVPPVVVAKHQRNVQEFLQSDFGRSATETCKRLDIDGEFLSERIQRYLNENNLSFTAPNFKIACAAVLDSISVTIDEDKGSADKYGASTLHTQHGSHDEQLPLGNAGMAGQRVASPYNSEKVWTEQAVRRELRILTADQLRERMADKAFVDALDKLDR